MLHQVPKNTRTEINHHTCDFHKNNPGKSFAGCTCSSSYSLIEED